MHTHKVIQFSCESCAKEFRVICSHQQPELRYVAQLRGVSERQCDTCEDTFPAKKRLECDDEMIDSATNYIVIAVYLDFVLFQ